MNKLNRIKELAEEIAMVDVEDVKDDALAYAIEQTQGQLSHLATAIERVQKEYHATHANP